MRVYFFVRSHGLSESEGPLVPREHAGVNALPAALTTIRIPLCRGMRPTRQRPARSFPQELLIAGRWALRFIRTPARRSPLTLGNEFKLNASMTGAPGPGKPAGWMPAGPGRQPTMTLGLRDADLIPHRRFFHNYPLFARPWTGHTHPRTC